MAEDHDLSPEYLAQSKVVLLTAFCAIPIPLEMFSTAFRVWVKLSPKVEGRIAFDDYVMIAATVCRVSLMGRVCRLFLATGEPMLQDT